MIARSLRFLLCLSLFSLGGTLRATADHEWPEEPPHVLREELFRIRVMLASEDRGPDGLKKFLREAVAKNPTLEAKVWAARVSLYWKGWDLKEPMADPATAEKWLEEGVLAESPVALEALGRAKIYGDSALPADPERGLELHARAAAAGLPRAIGTEGIFDLEGYGRPRNIARGALAVRRAAALGSVSPLRDAAAMLLSGKLLGAPSPAVAVEYYAELARYSGDGITKLEELASQGVPFAREQMLLARVRHCNDGRRIAPSVARAWVADLEKIQSFDARVAVELGVAHLVGAYAKRDHALAKAYFERAATMQEDARVFLAFMRARGFAAAKDVDGGVAEMQALAAGGNARAAAWLGSIHYWGDSDFPVVRKDPGKAFLYSRQAAQAGYPQAIFNLGFCYEHGIGTKENYALAAKIYWRAYEDGYQGAKERAIRNLAFAKVK